jgi:geranylgeranyl pyrophosphate synthase
LQYTSQKGFCEDLDEGKYSLPLIHALQTDPKNLLLNNILSTRRLHGKLTYEQKVFALEQIKACNSLDWTKSVLNNLRSQIAGEIERLEKVFNKNNPEIKALIELLGV